MPNTQAHDRANAEQVRLLREALQKQGVQTPTTPAQSTPRSEPGRRT